MGLERHADLIPGLIALRRIREAQGDLDGAEATLHRALGHDPTHPVVLESLAAIAAASGHDESARAWTAVAEAAEATDAEEAPTSSTRQTRWPRPLLTSPTRTPGWTAPSGGPTTSTRSQEAPALVTESLAQLYRSRGISSERPRRSAPSPAVTPSRLAMPMRQTPSRGS